LRSHPHEFLSQEEYVLKTYPYKVLEKSMPQIIDLSNKNNIYIIDFPMGRPFTVQENNRDINYHFNPIIILKIIIN
jgi:hypothetical protein